MKAEFEEQSTGFKEANRAGRKGLCVFDRKCISGWPRQCLAFDQQTGASCNRTEINFPGTVVSQRLAALQAQRVLMNTDFQLTAVAAQQVSARAQQLVQERAEHVAQYQKATGENVKEDAGINKWKERAAKTDCRTERGWRRNLQTPASSVASKIQAATAFRTSCRHTLMSLPKKTKFIGHIRNLSRREMRSASNT